MLQKLDWYIIKKYLATFFFTVLIFTLLTVVIDISEKIDNFMEEEVPLRLIITDYYITFIMFIHGLLFPVYALISVIFFTSRMAYNSEVIAMLASGISFRRIMRPYIVAGLILGSIYMALGHFMIPMGNKVLMPFQNKYIFKYDKESKTKDIHIYLDPTSKISIRHYSLRDSVARDVMIEEIRDGELVSKLTAKRADWKKETGRWKLTNYTIRSFDGMKEYYTTGANIDTLINLTPGDLERRDNLKTTMTSPELSRFLISERKRGTGKAILFEIELYNRTATAFTILVLTLIGMIISAKKVRGGTGLHLAIGALLGAVYIMFNQVSTTLSTNASFHPMLGVWLPNIIFFGIMLLLLRKAQR
ncbi:MAG: LptF/LptG family permease [Saprospiraceae bacterium]